jgi:hypothetical protein
VDQFTSQGAGELTTSQTVAMVMVFIDPARIMEESKEFHDFEVGPVCLGHAHGVFLDARPVEDAVVAVHRQAVTGEDFFQNGRIIMHGPMTDRG